MTLCVLCLFEKICNNFCASQVILIYLKTIIYFQRLDNIENEATGYLYGIMYNDTLVVLTFSINSCESDDENEDKKSMIDYTTLQLNLPADIYFCGILRVGECEEIDPDVFKVTDTRGLYN